jgi:hypothetical protein
LDQSKGKEIEVTTQGKGLRYCKEKLRSSERWSAGETRERIVSGASKSGLGRYRVEEK